jgi:hypothetical protein
LALISPTSGGRSVGIVRWRTKAPEFVVCFIENHSVKDIAWTSDIDLRFILKVDLYILATESIAGEPVK